MNQIFYISRKPAEDFLTALDKAFKEEPAEHPLLFQVYGIGGIGKSTLLEKVQEIHQQQGHIAKFDFSGKIPANETPLKVMVELYDQLPKPDIWKRELFKSDPFIRLCKQYDLWLSEYLLKEKELQLHPIRLVLAGRYSLRKKFPRSRDLIFERQLEKFDQRQTEAYLKEIGITDPKEIREISKATDGFPFHLDLIRQQKKRGERLTAPVITENWLIASGGTESDAETGSTACGLLSLV
jgi:hypothetical protein